MIEKPWLWLKVKDSFLCYLFWLTKGWGVGNWERWLLLYEFPIDLELQSERSVHHLAVLNATDRLLLLVCLKVIFWAWISTALHARARDNLFDLYLYFDRFFWANLCHWSCRSIRYKLWVLVHVVCVWRYISILGTPNRVLHIVSSCYFDTIITIFDLWSCFHVDW